ncbi:nucleic acid-binding, OB-fold-like protein [Actinidia rufa]|uniref:Nucleic acid-binding, OB-fold-like protein n=1 Tax=Actinidia rufa TaxID=165716 RepID=A0A7J0DW13_9ERIC|nr:nucleic acid-binding, OB-fold-like protein [Actinidia rufa]
MAEQTEKAFLKQPKLEENGEGEETWKGRESVLEEHWIGVQDSQRCYGWYEKRHSNIPAHISPCFRVKEGDHVIIGQCRPLSKTVRFNVLKVIPAGSSGGGKKAFTAM